MIVAGCLTDMTMSYNDEIFGSFYNKGTVIFRQGDHGDTMYVIQSGAVEVTQLQDGRETVLALLERGDFFGEMALIDERPRSATVKTIQPTRLLPLTRGSLVKRMRQDAGVAFHLLRALSHRIEQATNRLRKLVESDESLRLASDKRQEAALPNKFEGSTDVEETFSALKGGPYTEDHAIQIEDLSLAKQDKTYFEANQTIFSQGETGETLYIIAEGSVEIFQESTSGKCVLARLGPKDIFGEIALLTDLPRTATAITLKPTRLISLGRNEFIARVEGEPELALYVLQVLIMRLRKIHQAMADPEESMDVVQQILPPLIKHEGVAKVAIVSLSTCGGCAATILEDPEELTSLLERVQISYCPMLMDHNEIRDEVDVAIVDGAVRVKEDEEKLKEARKKSRHLVAWGTCAALGGIPTLANQYELEEVIEASYGQTHDPFDYYLSESRESRGAVYENEDLAMLRRAGKVADFVRVDYYLPGCPPQTTLLNQLVKELRGERQSGKPRQIVCSECSRKPRKMEVETLWVFPKSDWDPANCFSTGGAPCLGFLTRGGCGAVCPNNGVPCWGCRGPSIAALKKITDGDTFEQVVYSSLIKRCNVPETEIGAVMKILRSRGYSLLNFYHDTAFDLSKVR